tara:strand:- start:13060 stop:13362 length:303 start_codon:yes stop_codon:yes gene_type:complete
METNYSKEQRYINAQKRVKDIKGFYSHLIVMVILLPFLVFINLKFTPDYHWFWWAVFGNLLGLFFHWLGIFGFENLGLGKNWEDKKIQEYMNKDTTNFKK